MGKKEIDKTAILSFRAWLLAQTGRTDPVGAIARDCTERERSLGRPLRCYEQRWDWVAYVRAIPAKVGVTEVDERTAWNEWLDEVRRKKEQQQIERESTRAQR